MTIVANGSANATSSIVPDLIVQIIPPQVRSLNGVPTDKIGVVGSSSWGPKNSPIPFGTMGDYERAFGPIKARKYDMGTQAATAVLQGAQSFAGVRVTDGTDAAASLVLYTATVSNTAGGTGHVTGDQVTYSNGAVATVTASAGVITALTLIRQPITNGAGALAQTSTTGVGIGATATFTYSTGATLTSKYTGSLANIDTAQLGSGSAANTLRLTITRPGRPQETFDNIAGTAAAFWLALVTAVNNGNGQLRGPSDLFVATQGASVITGLPMAAVVTAAGGADGATTITDTILLGVDGLNRTGLYALRGAGASIGLLADADTSTSWSAQAAFGLNEGVYMMLTGPAGQTAQAGATAKAAAGLDTFAIKYLLGDWIYFNDQVNGQTRLTSPQGWEAGRLANLGPQESSLNKPIFGMAGTQRSLVNQPYSQAELQILGLAGIDLVCNPQPGGAYFGARFGRNGSSAAEVHGDNYTRMTNYIAATLNSGMGRFVGALQSRRTSDKTRQGAKATVDNFFTAMRDLGQLDDFQTVCDKTNNPDASIGQGRLVLDAKVVYLGIVETFLVNVEGGQTVQITRTSTQLQQAA